MDGPVFRSRIDPLLLALVFIPMLGVFGLLLRQDTNQDQSVGSITLLIFALSVGFAAWIFTSTTYRFSESFLLVRSGPFRVRVPVQTIRKVTRTRTLQSPPALSLQRLEIRYDKDATVVISPRDEAGFLAILQTKAPNAQLPTSN